MDTLTSMRAFLRVVQAGGFSKAAVRLDLSPAMVTKHVSSLEERLGVRLLNRTTRQVSLTEAGAAYFDHCARIVADLDFLAVAEHLRDEGDVAVVVDVCRPSRRVRRQLAERLVEPVVARRRRQLAHETHRQPGVLRMHRADEHALAVARAPDVDQFERVLVVHGPTLAAPAVA